jgi:hypothetical protein
MTIDIGCNLDVQYGVKYHIDVYEAMLMHDARNEWSRNVNRSFIKPQ